MTAIVTDELVERCARALYVSERPALGGDWDREGDAYRELYRESARAVLTEALRPPPDPPVRIDDTTTLGAAT